MAHGFQSDDLSTGKEFLKYLQSVFIFVRKDFVPRLFDVDSRGNVGGVVVGGGVVGSSMTFFLTVSNPIPRMRNGDPRSQSHFEAH